MTAIFTDAHESIEDIAAERDRVAVRHRFRGTQLAEFQQSVAALPIAVLAVDVASNRLEHLVPWCLPS